MQTTDNSISFSVDQVGVPVLVKASYFPNWSVDGAEGPYRVAPNFMVVVPTSNQVTLTYGTSGIEYLGYAAHPARAWCCCSCCGGRARSGTSPSPRARSCGRTASCAGTTSPAAATFQPEPATRPTDITGDHDRFEVLADQVFGPRESDGSLAAAAPTAAAATSAVALLGSALPMASALRLARVPARMSLLDQIVKAYDIRGTVPDQLDADICPRLRRRLRPLRRRPRILVGRDMRPSGVELVAAFAEGADVPGRRRRSTSVWCRPTSCTSPPGGFDAPGAMFTASHNPAQYNGVKLCLSGARPGGRRHRTGRHQGHGRRRARRRRGPPRRPRRAASPTQTCSTTSPTTWCPSSTPPPSPRSRSWPTPPTGWAGSWCPRSSSACPRSSWR